MPVRPEIAARYEELDGKPAELSVEVIDSFVAEMEAAHGRRSPECAHALALYARRARWLDTDLERGRATMVEALGIVGDDLRATNRVWWRHLLTLVCHALGDGPSALRYAEETLAVGEQVGQPAQTLLDYRAVVAVARAWSSPVGEVLEELRGLWPGLTDAQRSAKPAMLGRVAAMRVDLPDADRAALRAVTAAPDAIVAAISSLRPVADLAALRAALAELDDLTGLHGVKRQVRRLVAELRVREARRAAGLPVPEGVHHMVFLGPPGTGKTTVARLLGRIFKALGILATDTLVETDRSGLVAQYVGQTAPMVNAKVDEAIGGVLFVDEAYALAPASANDFGHEAISTLVKRMEDDRHRLVVVLAGYRDEMEQLLATNPGLRSRVPTVVDFRSYTGAELQTILMGMFRRDGLVLTPEAEERVARLCGLLRSGAADRSFGNAREARNILEDTVGAQAVRLEARLDAGETLGPDELARIEADDVTWAELGDPALDRLDPLQAAVVAVHEAGHAVVRRATGASDPVLVTIVPSGTAAGRTFYAEADRSVVLRADLIAVAASALGGRAAEEEVYGQASAGALGDLAVAERILFGALRAGLSEESSDRALVEYVLSGAGGPDGAGVSAQARQEVAQMLAEAWAAARAAVREHRASLDALSGALVELRTVTGDELERLLPPAPASPVSGRSG